MMGGASPLLVVSLVVETLIALSTGTYVRYRQTSRRNPFASHSGRTCKCCRSSHRDVDGDGVDIIVSTGDSINQVKQD